jgi:hypothetical protein
MSVGIEQVINRIARLMGEVQAGGNPVMWLKLNPRDAALISDHIYSGAFLGAVVTDDDTLRPGTCELDILGKRPLY